MNRRGFLKNLGFTGAAIVIAPLVSFAPIPKRLIHKVELPAFMLFYTDGKQHESGELVHKSMARVVQTYKGTLKELCSRYPNDEIFFYQEVKNGNFDYVRACVIKKEPNMQILAKPNYEI